MLINKGIQEKMHAGSIPAASTIFYHKSRLKKINQDYQQSLTNKGLQQIKNPDLINHVLSYLILINLQNHTYTTRKFLRHKFGTSF